MKENPKLGQQQSSNPTDSLEQKLLTTRYSVVDKMASVQESLDKQQTKIKKQKQKLKQLTKRLTQLQVAELYNNRTAQRYQEKLEKLESTQSMSIALLSIKANNQKERDQYLLKRQQACSQLRENILQSRRKSLQIFQKRKTARVHNIKKQQFNYYLQNKRLSQSQLQNRRNKTNEIRQSEIIGRQRLKRYQLFKLAQARFNYDERKEQLIRSHADKLNQLRNLKTKAEGNEEVFRKTQILNDEVQQIQSLYITGQ